MRSTLGAKLESCIYTLIEHPGDKVPTILSDVLFLSLVALVYASIATMIFRTGGDKKRAALALWLLVPVVTGALAMAGVTAKETIPPPFLFINIVLFTGAILVARSSVGSAIIKHTPLLFLVGAQAFRLPLELLLHRLATEGALPDALTFAGYNFDIATGTLALLYVFLRHRILAIAIQVVGVCCLLAILVIVILAFPVPFALISPALTLPARFPYVWLPTVLVLGAVFLHALAIRALFQKSPLYKSRRDLKM